MGTLQTCLNYIQNARKEIDGGQLFLGGKEDLEKSRMFFFNIYGVEKEIKINY